MQPKDSMLGVAFRVQMYSMLMSCLILGEPAWDIIENMILAIVFPDFSSSWSFTGLS